MTARRHLRAGLRMLDRDRPDRAVERLRRAAERDPENGLALLHLARALVRLGDPEGARAAAERTLDLRPDEPAFLILAGEVILDTGRLRDARRLFLRALQLSPRNRLARDYATFTRWLVSGEQRWAERLCERGLPDSVEFLGRLLMAVEERLRPESAQPEADLSATGVYGTSPVGRLLGGAPPAVHLPLARREAR